MGTRHPLGAAGFVLLAALLAAFVCDVAGAQTRWPPWQSYGEAERAAREKQKRRAIPKQSQIDALNAQVAQLRQAGKTDEAIAVAKQALNLTQRRHGRNHVATAAALTTLAELLIAKESYAQAEPLLKRALAIREKSKDSKEIAQALDNLAELYEKQGQKDQAKQLADRAVVLRGGQVPAEPKPKKAPAAKVQEAPKTPGAAAPSGYADKKREGGGVEKEEGRSTADAEEKGAREQSEHAQPRQSERPRTAEARRVAEETMARGGTEAERGTATAKKAIEEAGSSRAAEAEQLREVRPKAWAYRKGPPAAAAPPSSTSAEPDLAARSAGTGAPEAMEVPADGAASMEGPMPTAPGAAPPPPPAAAAPEVGVLAEEEKWDVVPVFFGTDRAEEANPKRLSYGSDRGRRLELGRALVTVPKAHEVPQVERPWAIRIPYFNVTIYEEAEDPNKHFTLQEIKKLSKGDLIKLVRERLAASGRFKDQALVFVHGYNTSFDNAVYRTAQIAYDLKFDGAPFLYSWPSGGAVASYTYDRESAEASKPYMRQFLDMVVKETGAKAVSIIAHSMGNQPLLDVLKDMKSSAPEGVVISQVILAAPDVDADSFSNLAQAINGMAKGVTLYAASNDRALIVSRNFWGHYRAGDVPAEGPVVLPGIDTIDVTAASTDAFALNHSEYAQDTKVLEDIRELIETGKRPPDARLLAPARVATDHGDYWRYTAPPSP